MNQKLLYILLTQITFQCSMSRNWISPTLDEQINKAGIILIATVKKVPQNFGSASITLKNIEYIRGCNKQEITVDKFRGGSMCGAGIPSVNDKIIVFACGDNNNKNKNIRLHNFTSFTGFVRWNQANEDLVRKLVGRDGEKCRDRVFSERCMRRDLDICKKIKSMEPLVAPVYKEPVLEEVEEPVLEVMDYNKFEGQPIGTFRNLFSGYLNRRYFTG